MTARAIIDLLCLEKHPKEGGYFRETYRSRGDVPAEHLPPGYPGPRSLATAIYYLITADSFSAMHRLPGEEIFHHYLGDAVEMLLLHPSGEHEIVLLGKDLARGERPQVVVPGGVWQGSKLASGGEFALLGCTMSPGFDYADYEHGRRAELMAQYPAAAARISQLTS
jgi:predicted cupin superfamily sugar epimerase